MAKLFIANTTKQHHDFAYRIAEERQARQETIRAGTQMAIGGELTHDVIVSIIQQHEAYGLRDATTISRMRDFVGLCYSIDKPVPLDNMLYTFEKNDETLNDRAANRREQAAAAIAQNIQSSAAELGVRVPRTEVETVEETRGQPNVDNRFEILEQGVNSRHGAKPSTRSSGRA